MFARAMLPDRAELEEARAARAEADALAERREQLTLLNAMNGNPLAELSRAQSATAAARDVVRDLEGRLSEAREALSRAEGNLAVWGSQVEELHANVARRSSAEIDLLTPAKRAHQEFAAATRAAFEAVQAGTPRRAPRPFAGHGNATRSEYCFHCTNEGLSDEQSYLLHLDPQYNVPTSTEEQALAAEQAKQAAKAEHRGHSSYAEISR